MYWVANTKSLMKMLFYLISRITEKNDLLLQSDRKLNQSEEKLYDFFAWRFADIKEKS